MLFTLCYYKGDEYGIVYVVNDTFDMWNIFYMFEIIILYSFSIGIYNHIMYYLIQIIVDIPMLFSAVIW